MRKLVGMQLDESKSGAEHLSLFTGTLSQLQDSDQEKSKGGSSANMVRGRTDKRSNNAQRNKSKSRERGNGSKGKNNDATCYQCGGKGHKKPDCRYYKAQLERNRNAGDKKKGKKEDKTDAQDIQKDKERPMWPLM
ncbi:hypothetical protein KP509_08G045900 [Ceratopteris richardii]|uniref:CCHC-type domain-containing protein n=1 Tax=Ceratopteris richardii TaxID=49495 RepID=A0A8T2U9L1_CERRI|nr:hypothetical protein KP509_08G045900 [Ceratopteris richardii]